ncbi:MAG: SpoIIE family protein phosphatase [Desulfobacterales bacterium]|jgi:serine phosphatase RsbU (regulator of sigma subunit)
MHDSAEKLFFFSLLGIFVFSLPFHLNAAETAETSVPICQAGDNYLIEPASAGQNNRRVPANETVHSKWDIYEVLFGTHMVIIGLVAVALALYRWKATDLSLISFGVFCFFYGARTRAFQFLVDAPPIFWAYWGWLLTYFTPVPAYIFFEQFIGKGWKSSVRRIWQIQIVFAIAAAAVDVFLRAPGTAMIANNVMAIGGILVVGINLFRPGLGMTRELLVLKSGIVVFAITALYQNIAPLLTSGYEIIDLETPGFLVFMGCLVYAVAHRFFRNEKDLVTISHELETARKIQSFILPQKTVDIDGIYLAARYVPMASVAGDFYDFIKVDEKSLGILVADVSGHGVPASLISSMVKIALSSQRPHAYNPARVLAGINQILCGNLESDFVTAGYLFIDTAKQTTAYAGAGHPPLLLWREAQQKIIELRQRGIILGQFEDARYQNIEHNLNSGDRFILYTDGIIEASDATGTRFGLDQFKEFITSHAGLSAGRFADALIQRISGWTGKHHEKSLDDDLTLVVADFKSG